MRRTKSRILSIVLAMVMMVTLAVPAMAAETGTVKINASTISKSEVSREIELAAIEGKTVVLSWKDGATATLRPVSEFDAEPYLNTTKTLTLRVGDWSTIVNDTPFWPTVLEVTNKAGNPGSIDVRIETDYAVDGIHYYYDLPEGYYATFDLVFPTEYGVYAQAVETAGKYSIKVSDW